MSLAYSTLAVVTSLAATVGGLEVPPGAGGPSDGQGREHVTAIALTDSAGSLTSAATAGLGELSAEQDALLGTASAEPAEEPPAEVAVLTPAMATPEFVVAGLTWSGRRTLEPSAQAFARLQEDGGWTEWFELEAEDVGPDGLPEDAVAGTEPIISGGATGIQLQVRGGADDLPADLELSLVPARPGAEREVVTEPLPLAASLPSEPITLADDDHEQDGDASAFSADAAAPPAVADPLGARVASDLPAHLSNAVEPRPSVISRAGWGVDESIPVRAGVGTWQVRYADLRAAVVHHTAGTNNYRREDSAAIVRGIYHFHAVTRGWGDIGYNFLVDRFGQIFEGRKGTLESAQGKMVIGGHARGYNSGSLGVSVMGNFVSVAPPTVSVERITDVITWQFARSAVDMSKPSGMISPGNATRPAGQNLPRIFGHKDVASTSCPGRIYELIPGITVATRARLPQLFHLNNAFTATADVSFYFGDRRADVFTGDWDGNGTDTVAVRMGNVFFIRNNHSYAEADRVIAYGRPGDKIVVGDWDGNGTDTFAVRRGAEYHIKNSLTGGPADRVVTYGRATDEVLAGDWDGNGTDTLAVRRGAQYYIKNTLRDGAADVVITYGRVGDVVLVGDWNGDRRDTLGVRRANMYYLKNTLRTGVADVTVAYGAATDLTVVGDWNGDRKTTLGVRRLP